MTENRRSELEQQLVIYQRNRATLENQVAKYGGEMGSELRLINQLKDTNEKIEALLLELSPLVPDTALYFNIWTYDQGNMRSPEYYSIDLTPYYSSQAPDLQAWDNEIFPLLTKFVSQCNNQNSADIAGYVNATQPAAVALGSLFMARSRYTLWIKQRNGAQNEWWRNDAPPENANLPSVQIAEGAGEDAVIELCTVPNQDIRPAVTRAISDLGLSVGNRVSIAFDDAASEVQNAAHAVAIAHQIREQILKARRTVRGKTVHLFLLTPVALAVFIGTQLNTCGPIQCYEHRKAQGDYVPACLLRG